MNETIVKGDWIDWNLSRILAMATIPFVKTWVWDLPGVEVHVEVHLWAVEESLGLAPQEGHTLIPPLDQEDDEVAQLPSHVLLD